MSSSDGDISNDGGNGNYITLPKMHKTHKTHKMKMPDVMGFLSCTPLKIYLAIALLSVLIYYANNLIKGKFDFSNCSSLMCCILCSAFVIAITCNTNLYVSWTLTIVFSICAMCFAMGSFGIKF